MTDPIDPSIRASVFLSERYDNWFYRAFPHQVPWYDRKAVLTSEARKKVEEIEGSGLKIKIDRLDNT